VNFPRQLGFGKLSFDRNVDRQDKLLVVTFCQVIKMVVTLFDPL